MTNYKITWKASAIIYISKYKINLVLNTWMMGCVSVGSLSELIMLIGL